MADNIQPGQRIQMLKLINAEVKAQSDEARLKEIYFTGVLEVLCQQARANIDVIPVALGFEGDYWPTNHTGDEMSSTAVVIMDNPLGNAVSLVVDSADIQKISQALVDDLCTKADCHGLGCVKQRIKT